MRSCALLALALTISGLAGCGSSFELSSSPSPGQSSISGIQGTVLGGRQPVVGAHVFVLAASTTGYGGNGIAPSSSNASTSLLTVSSGGSYPTALDANAADATYGDYYQTTGSAGDFLVTGEYTCTVGTQIYLYIVGGDPGSGTNSAAGFLAALGQCPASGTLGAAFPHVTVNEISTVAAAYALAGFATDALHIGSSGTPAALVGIANAFANAANLYDVTGAHGTIALASTPAGNATVPQTTINSLGNSLGACVSSTGPTSTQCSALFTDAQSAGTSGTMPTDTATAAINIAHYPGTNVAAIFGLTAGVGTSYVPTLTAAPADFTVSLKYSISGYPAVDASGDVWVANNDVIYELGPTGAFVSPATGFTGPGQEAASFTTSSVAIDPSGNAWVVGSGTSGGKLYEVSSAGSFLNPVGGFSSVNPYSMAVDGTGVVWIAGYMFVERISSSGAVLSTGQSTYIYEPYGIAFDPAGHAWIANTTGLLELSSSLNILSNGGTGPYTGSDYSDTTAVAVDHTGNLWVTNIGTGNAGWVTKVTSAGTPLSGTTGGYSVGTCGGYGCSPRAVSIDGAGNAWMAESDEFTAYLHEVSNTGSLLSPPSGYGPYWAFAVAVDGSGNVWLFTNPFASTAALVEMVGLAVPVVTPLSLGVKNNTLGTRP